MHRFIYLLILFLFAQQLPAQKLKRQDLDDIQQLIYDNKYAEAQSAIYTAFKKEPDPNQLTWLNILMSDVKRILGTMEDAMKFARTSLKITYSDKEKGNINRSLSYHKIANIFYEEKKYDSAYVYADRSIKQAEEFMGPNNIRAMRTMNLSIIGYYHLQQKDFAKAEAAFMENIRINEETDSQCETPLQYLKLADLEMNRGDLNKAGAYARKAKKIADGCKINVYTFSAISKLIDIYRMQNNANGIYLLFAERDSLSAHDNTEKQRKEVAALEVRYQSELKDRENETLKISNQREKEINLVITIGFGVALLLLAGSIVIVVKTRRKNQLIAEQKAEVDRLNVLNRKIFSVISHDFRGPLQNLQGALELSENGILDAESFSQLTHAIRLQMGQAQQIMENLISWAKSEMSLEESSRKSAFVRTVAEEIASQFEKAASAKKIAIEITIPDELEMKLPPDALQIVYRNVLGNAIKYSFESGKIEMGYSETKNFLFVKDSGTGINEELAKKLFLNRVSSKGGTQSETGYGLGLHLVSELVRKHGGSIWADPNPDGGVIICFRLPKI